MTHAPKPPQRRRLSNRRRHELIHLVFRGRDYIVGVGRFSDNSPGEVFIDTPKASNDLADAARDAAVTLSIALQYGAPLNAIREAVARNADGSAAGIIGAVLDLLASEAGA